MIDSAQNTAPKSTLTELELKIEFLEAEKRKLEIELKAREEMMNNLLTYIQNSPK